MSNKENATPGQMACPHDAFGGSICVNRIEDKGVFMADITIGCTRCGLPFHFVGLDLGLSFTRPMVSVGQTELRVPIAPGEVHPGASGVARFEVGT